MKPHASILLLCTILCLYPSYAIVLEGGIDILTGNTTYHVQNNITLDCGSGFCTQFGNHWLFLNNSGKIEKIQKEVTPEFTCDKENVTISEIVPTYKISNKCNQIEVIDSYPTKDSIKKCTDYVVPSNESCTLASACDLGTGNSTINGNLTISGSLKTKGLSFTNYIFIAATGLLNMIL